MAKFSFTLTLLSLLFAFALARTPSDSAEKDVAFLDLSNNSPAELKVKPTLLLPSQRTTIHEPNTASEEETDSEKPFPFGNDALVAGEEEDQRKVDGENDGVVVEEEEDQRRVDGENDDVEIEEEDQKPVEDENVDGVVEAEKEDLERPLTTTVRFRPVNRHFRRTPCRHWMKRMMRMRTMRHRMEGRQVPYGREFFHGGEMEIDRPEMGEFRGHESREAEEEEHEKPMEIENNDVVAATEDHKPTEPETQTLDLTRPITVVSFPMIDHHPFRRPCHHHHWMKHMMRMGMGHRMHGHEMPYGRDMILRGGERKSFDREFFRGGERKEVDSEMGEFHDGERKEIDMGMFRGEGERKDFISKTFRGGERKELDREMFRGIEGDHHVPEMRPQWMGHHHHHDDHEGRPWFPFFGRHHHHDHERFDSQSSRRPFYRREEGEEGREEGGFFNRVRSFITNHF